MPAKQLQRSSGNVFRDLSFAPLEAENLRIRSELMMRIRKEIERRELTQTEAARRFGVSQPRISDLVRGKIDLFSIDALVSMLGTAGARVTLSIRSIRKAA